VKKMLKELLEAKYQNFYINDDGVICGIVTPREIWKLNLEYVAELQVKYQRQISTGENSNYDLARATAGRAERALKRLNAAIKKLNGGNV
jgi:hypothetical protein